MHAQQDLSEIDGQPVWLITLSVPHQGLLTCLGNPLYKVFAVNGETGEVLSMKIRDFPECMTELNGLVDKHRANGLLIDVNLFCSIWWG